MYRNIIHKCGPETNWASIIHLFTWNEDGVPVDYEIPYIISWKKFESISE